MIDKDPLLDLLEYIDGDDLKQRAEFKGHPAYLRAVALAASCYEYESTLNEAPDGTFKTATDIVVQFANELVASLPGDLKSQELLINFELAGRFADIVGMKLMPLPRDEVPVAKSPSTAADKAINKFPLWKWPDTEPPNPNGGGFDPDFWYTQSALKMLGYTTGAKGMSDAERRSFLKQFLDSRLPPAVEAVYGNEYGEPGSTNRLRKMSNVIASNCRNFKLNDGTKYQIAISHWERDLEYLRTQFYEGRGLRFQPWPSTDI
ncbi:MAG: hypothetical protein NXI19_15685 [Alphaproteobacteria bacterium]|nr:hypothetical protein [Alphaproteobacteria bacterium]